MSQTRGSWPSEFYDVQAKKPTDNPQRGLRNTEQKTSLLPLEDPRPMGCSGDNWAECLMGISQAVTNGLAKIGGYGATFQGQKESTSPASCALISIA